MPRSSLERDRELMTEAVVLARRGLGRTSPNPAVGAVVARAGRIVGQGWHRRAGGPHAEIFALRQAGRRARGATLYVTLEPCCHVGRTGPCVEAVVAAGVKRVVIGAIDPNPRVRGKGIARLRRAGVELTVGVLAEECRELIADFEKRVTTGLPFVVLKLAATLDGRIATACGDSRWITGEPARRRVHELRNRFDAVVVGSETVLRDDPELTSRIPGARDPIRVVLDGRLRSPESSRVFQNARARTRVYTRAGSTAKARRLAARGVVIRPGGGDRPGSFRHVLRDLAGAGVTSVLVEGGGTLAARALRERLVDRISIFLAPKLLGGDARPMLGALAIRRVKDALPLEILGTQRVGEDLWIQARPPFRRSV